MRQIHCFHFAPFVEFISYRVYFLASLCFTLLLNFPVTFFYLSSNILHCLCHLGRISSVVWQQMYVEAIFWGFRPCIYSRLHSPLASASIPRPPLLHSSIFLSTFFSCLLLYVIAKSLQSSRLCLLLTLPTSFTHPLLSLSASLFCDCSAWSPCGTPCRVPNLFIISSLCQDARGMLKYTPPRSGYKWAGVLPSFLRAPTAQPTRPLGWTDLTSQT